MRRTKAQMDLARLCLEQARGLEIEGVKKPESACGITTGFAAALAEAKARNLPMEHVHCREKSAWDAVCAFSQFTGTTGAGYFQRMFNGAAALLRASGRANTVCVAFDDAEYIAASIPGLTRVCEDVQRALALQAERPVGLRLIFSLGRRDAWVNRDEAGRWIGGWVPQYPKMRMHGMRGWEWGQSGLKAIKERDAFKFWDVDEDAPLLSAVSA